MKIIAFCGPAGCGKTEAATYASKKLNAQIIPFARPLKRIAHSMGWNGHKDAKGRKLLQLLGTECGRKCVDPYIWTHLWFKEASQQGVVIVDDLRFRNEADVVYNNGGVICRIIGRNEPPWWRLPFLHVSERDWRYVTPTYVIDNSGSLDDLKYQVWELFK